MFTHITHDIPKLKRVDSPEGRVYQTPSGHAYPSVTAVTGLHGKQAIMEWRKRVGEAEANRISSIASRRGTRIHSLCEDYLSNKATKAELFDVEAFNSIKPFLNRIDNIHCLETKLYSDHLKVAGTVDCIAEFDGKMSVIDFKTSKRPKTSDEIHNYYMQASAYAVMFEERTGIPVNRLVIMMTVDNQDTASIFYERRDNWINDFISLRKEYERCKNI
jgi:genome maintenance exonuclease 1